MAGQILVATQGCFAKLEGHPRGIPVTPGRTTAREGHPIVDANPGLWEPLVPDFEVDDKPARKPAAKQQAQSEAAEG